MDRSAHKRLLSITRHLLPLEANTSDILRPIPTSAMYSKPADYAPVIIGGMVLDIHAKPYTPAKPGTTTPGKVEYMRGGVARNVAECMSKLAIKPFMISVIGHDLAGDILFEHWKSSGLPTEGILKSQNTTTPVVTNIFDASGELAAAVASVEAVEKCLTKDWIEQFRCIIHSASVLMIDANLHPQALEVACQTAEFDVPVWFEPVSVLKSKRVASIAKYITFASPNEDELIAMANALCYGNDLYSYQNVEKLGERKSIKCKVQLLKPAICLLLDEGIRVVMVTIGSDGVLLCLREDPNFMKDYMKKTKSNYFGGRLYKLVNDSCHSYQHFAPVISGEGHFRSYALHFPALPASVVSLTGAGDCLVGGALASICSGLSIAQSMGVAVSTAKAAVETKANVPFEFSLTKIADEARQIFSSAKLFSLD